MLSHPLSHMTWWGIFAKVEAFGTCVVAPQLCRGLCSDMTNDQADDQYNADRSGNVFKMAFCRMACQWMGMKQDTRHEVFMNDTM